MRVMKDAGINLGLKAESLRAPNALLTRRHRSLEETSPHQWLCKLRVCCSTLLVADHLHKSVVLFSETAVGLSLLF